MALKQGDKSFEDYAEEAIRLKSLVGPDSEALLCEQWANGCKTKRSQLCIETHGVEGQG